MEERKKGKIKVLRRTSRRSRTRKIDPQNNDKEERKMTVKKTKQKSQKKHTQVKQKNKFVRDICSCSYSALNMQQVKRFLVLDKRLSTNHK